MFLLSLYAWKPWTCRFLFLGSKAVNQVVYLKTNLRVDMVSEKMSSFVMTCFCIVLIVALNHFAFGGLAFISSVSVYFL